eukprot:Rmarinus@m.6970
MFKPNSSATCPICARTGGAGHCQVCLTCPRMGGWLIVPLTGCARCALRSALRTRCGAAAERTRCSDVRGRHRRGCSGGGAVPSCPRRRASHCPAMWGRKG